MKTHLTNFRLMALLSLLLIATGVCAEEKEKKEAKDDKYPLGCRNVGYVFDLKILKLLPEESGERQSLYFIFNNLSTKISLYQMLKNDSTRSMYLNHVILPRQWSVLSTSESELKYICSVEEGKSTYGKIVDCADSLKVCEFARVKYGMNNQGNFWLVNSNTNGGAVREVLNYGIIPR